MNEVLGDARDRRVELLCEHDALHATWTRFGPHRDGANLHVHYHHTDGFYVLKGVLTVKLETGEIEVPEGNLVIVPPLVVHGFRNGGDEDLEYLNFHAPGCGFADYMRGIADFDQADPPESGTRPASEASIGPLPGDLGTVVVGEGAADPLLAYEHVTITLK